MLRKGGPIVQNVSCTCTSCETFDIQHSTIVTSTQIKMPRIGIKLAEQNEVPRRSDIANSTRHFFGSWATWTGSKETCSYGLRSIMSQVPNTDMSMSNIVATGMIGDGNLIGAIGYHGGNV